MLLLKKNCLAVLLVVLWMPGAQAFDFYAGIVPVNDRSQVSFQQGVNAALLQVLGRLSGDAPEKLLQNPHLAEDLNNAERFTSQFMYKTSLDATQKPQIYLQASFPEKIVMGLVKKGQLRFFAPRKTDVLLLPLVSQAGMARLETGHNDQLLIAAQKVGVALVAGGQRQEDARLLWSGDEAYISQLMNDYGKSMMVLVRAVDAQFAKGQWVLMVDGKPASSVDINSINTVAFIDQGLAWLAGQLVDKTAVELSAKPGKLEMSLTGIETYQQYERALTYLEQISIVESLSLLAVENATLSLQLNLGTSVDQLDKILLAEKKINIVTTADGQKNYHWNE